MPTATRLDRRTLLAATAALAAAAPAARAADLPADLPADLSKASLRAPVEQALRALLARQAAQWSAGDLVGFCAHYADDAVFVSPSGRTDGRAAVLARYQKKYVDKAGMGALSLEVLHVLAQEDAAGARAVASVVMTWRLVFAAGADGKAKEPAQGFSVIALERQRGVWKIVHDASM